MIAIWRAATRNNDSDMPDQAWQLALGSKCWVQSWWSRGGPSQVDLSDLLETAWWPWTNGRSGQRSATTHIPARRGSRELAATDHFDHGANMQKMQKDQTDRYGTPIYTHIIYIYVHNYNSKGSMKDVFSTSMLIYQRVWPLGYGLYVIYMLRWSLIRNTVSYRNMTSRSRVTDGDRQDFPMENPFFGAVGNRLDARTRACASTT